MKKNQLGILFMIVTIFICGYIVINEFKTTRDLKSEINKNEALIKELNTEKTQLKENEKNLKDDDYLIRYARGKYMVTGDSEEQVFKIGE